ncbi:MAG: hypothetical protein ACI4RR_01215, partial [Eubacterium sp.]
RSRVIDEELVSQVAGLAGREALYQLSDCICTKDSSSAMSVISQLYQNSYDMERLCVEMINHFRNYLIVKTVKKSRELIICTDDEYDKISVQAGSFTLENVIFALDLFQDTLVKIKSGASSRIEMEMAFVKLCEPKLEESQAAILDRLSTLERAVKQGQTVQISAQQNVSEPDTAQNVQPDSSADVTEAENNVQAPPEKKEQPEPVMKNDEVIPTPEQESEASPAAEENPPLPTPPIDNSNVQVEFEQWAEFMEVIHKSAIALYGVLNGAKGYIRGEHFLISTSNPAVREFLKTPTYAKAIKQALYEVTGKSYKLGLFKQKENQTQKKDLLEDLINQAQSSIKINFE